MSDRERPNETAGPIERSLKMTDDEGLILRLGQVVRPERGATVVVWGPVAIDSSADRETAGQGDSIGFVGLSPEAEEDWWDDVWTQGGEHEKGTV